MEGVPNMQHVSLRCEVLEMAMCCQMHTPGMFSGPGMEVWVVWVGLWFMIYVSFFLRDVTNL